MDAMSSGVSLHVCDVGENLRRLPPVEVGCRDLWSGGA